MDSERYHSSVHLNAPCEVQQMTGLADPVYVEAFLQVHSFDLMLELLVVNRTNETLQNVLVELSTQVCGGCGRGEVETWSFFFWGRFEGLRSKVSQVEFMIDLGREVISSLKSNHVGHASVSGFGEMLPC